MFGKLGLADADLEEMLAAIPARRSGNPGEIAHAIVFLASDKAAFTVGSEFVVDCGIANL